MAVNYGDVTFHIVVNRGAVSDVVINHGAVFHVVIDHSNVVFHIVINHVAIVCNVTKLIELDKVGIYRI